MLLHERRVVDRNYIVVRRYVERLLKEISAALLSGLHRRMAAELALRERSVKELASVFECLRERGFMLDPSSFEAIRERLRREVEKKYWVLVNRVRLVKRLLDMLRASVMKVLDAVDALLGRIPEKEAMEILSSLVYVLDCLKLGIISLWDAITIIGEIRRLINQRYGV